MPGRWASAGGALADAWGATPPGALRGYHKGIRFALHAVAPTKTDGRQALAGA